MGYIAESDHKLIG